MRTHLFLCLLLLALAFPSCASHDKGDKEKAKQKQKPPKPNIPDSSSDTNFQAFLGRLKTAVHNHDRAAIAGTMAQDFGWRWEQPQPGNPFDYWDQNNSWPELERAVNQRFSPSGDYMVSPPEFATNSNYDGPRVGLRMINGSWRFAYFVTGKDILQ